MSPIIEIILYFITFAVSLYALSAIDFAKFIFAGRVVQTQILILLLAMALAYLVVQFLLGLSFSF